MPASKSLLWYQARVASCCRCCHGSRLGATAIGRVLATRGEVMGRSWITRSRARIVALEKESKYFQFPFSSFIQLEFTSFKARARAVHCYMGYPEKVARGYGERIH